MNIVGLGGGENSKAMIVGMYKAGITIDLILFADTGAEMQSTYDGIDQLQEWLKEKDLVPVTIVKYIHGSNAYTTLEEECIQQFKLPSIAYGGIKSCSLKWKLMPQEKHCKGLPEIQAIWAKGERVNRYVGYDSGEENRIDNARKYDRVNKEYKNIYWLYEQGWDREKCRAVNLEEFGFNGGKSSCFFCPNMRPTEVINLYLNHSDYFDRAVEMEHNANLTKLKGLGRTWSWEELAKTWQSVYDTKYGIELSGPNFEIAMKDCIDVAREIMKDKAKQIYGQASICDFMNDDDDKAACGCYDG